MDSQLTVLSFGGGQDSTALLYKLALDPEFRQQYAPQDLLVLFSDTLDEHPETYAHLEWIKVYTMFSNIEFAWIKSHKSGSWVYGLRGWMMRNNGLQSKAFPKSCTDQLKIRPIYRWLEDFISKRYGLPKKSQKRTYYDFKEKYGKIRVILGIAADEDRVSEPEDNWMGRCIEKVYPLKDLGWDRAACQAYITSKGYKVPPPSNCMLCPFMSDIELLWLYRFHPRDYQHWVKLEAAKLRKWKDKGDRNVGVWGKANFPLPLVLERALSRHGHLTDEQLQEYKMSHGHCVKSKY